MAFPNIFTKEVSDDVINRINKLTAESQRQWGKMDVGKMLAHCSVAYETIYEPGKHPAPNFFMKIILKTFVRKMVTGDNPLKKNSQTAPYFIIKSDKDFAVEKARLIEYVQKTQQLGEAEFDGKENMSFGVMNKTEWSNMMYKHLDHHLQQFGA
jgi:Protein of unknown function (DUF1569)